MVFPALKKTLWQMLGPSIILVSLSLSGGEMLLWPNLSANYGLSILWPIPIILLLQFFVNIEIERYTLVTGKSVGEGLVSGRRWLAVIFAITILIALVWPAWITVAGNLVANILGYTGQTARNVGLITSISLLCLTIFIFRKPNTYRILERLARISLVVTLLIIFFIVGIKFDLVLFLEGVRGLLHWGFIPKEMPRFDFVAALAYGGVAGVLNLVQGEWVRDKGYGINSLPETEQNQIDFKNTESQKNYRRWFSLINKEHFFIYVLANFFAIFLLSYLGRLLLPFGEVSGFQVLIQEIAVLNASVPYLGLLFALSGTIIFIMANITILDAIGRLIFRMIKPLLPALSTSGSTSRLIQNLTSSKISEISVYLGILILLLSLIFPALKQPFFLLVLSASLSAFTMWIYPPLLIVLNTRLPKPARPAWYRSILVILAALFYGVITLWALSDYLPIWFVITLGIVVSTYHVFILLSLRKNNEN